MHRLFPAAILAASLLTSTTDAHADWPRNCSSLQQPFNLICQQSKDDRQMLLDEINALKTIIAGPAPAVLPTVYTGTPLINLGYANIESRLDDAEFDIDMNTEDVFALYDLYATCDTRLTALEDGTVVTPPGDDVCYVDSDNDGFGGASIDPGGSTCSSLGLLSPADIQADGQDCDDNDNNDIDNPDAGDAFVFADEINPDAAEICNGVDDDCDGRIDEGSICHLSTVRAYIEPMDNVTNLQLWYWAFEDDSRDQDDKWQDGNGVWFTDGTPPALDFDPSNGVEYTFTMSNMPVEYDTIWVSGFVRSSDISNGIDTIVPIGVNDSYFESFRIGTLYGDWDCNQAYGVGELNPHYSGTGDDYDGDGEHNDVDDWRRVWVCHRN